MVGGLVGNEFITPCWELQPAFELLSWQMQSKCFEHWLKFLDLVSSVLCKASFADFIIAGCFDFCRNR